MKYQQTPSQTLGPFFAYGLTPEQYLYDFKSIADNILVKDDNVQGERIILSGQIFDGNGAAITDAMVEIFQVDSEGKYSSDLSKFAGFGRMGTGTEKGNRFIFHTIKPGRFKGQAPHINVIILMRGLLNHLFTRIYFSDEDTANANDKILDLVPVDRKETLIAKRREKNGQIFYDIDIYMQGKQETVFFDA